MKSGGLEGEDCHKENSAYRPTKFSKTELFPALCPPTTAI